MYLFRCLYYFSVSSVLYWVAKLSEGSHVPNVSSDSPTKIYLILIFVSSSLKKKNHNKVSVKIYCESVMTQHFCRSANMN